MSSVRGIAVKAGEKLATYSMQNDRNEERTRLLSTRGRNYRLKCESKEPYRATCRAFFYREQARKNVEKGNEGKEKEMLEKAEREMECRVIGQ